MTLLALVVVALAYAARCTVRAAIVALRAGRRVVGALQSFAHPPLPSEPGPTPTVPDHMQARLARDAEQHAQQQAHRAEQAEKLAAMELRMADLDQRAAEQAQAAADAAAREAADRDQADREAAASLWRMRRAAGEMLE
ncbi:MAG TPA: hypothetical protein VGF94_13390 [Kofleriaceae bacterium]|jgi:type IV secretory pathway VirB10-like protein